MPNILVISPARNESEFIGETLESVVAQTIRPREWVIVDDHSNDGTAEIVKKFAAKHRWIHLVAFPEHSPRVPGGKVVQVFQHGLAHARIRKYDFLVKLDTDLKLDKDYFEKLIEEFNRDKRLGIASGICLERREKGFFEEKIARHHAHGATKVYRRRCYEEIGGLQPTLGWDGIDEYSAMFKGWKTMHFRSTSFRHFRPTGTEGGVLKGKYRMGRSFWLIGYHPLFVIVRTFAKFFQPPAVLGSLAIATGYFAQALKRAPQACTPELRKYVRRNQLSRLLSISQTEK